MLVSRYNNTKIHFDNDEHEKIYIAVNHLLKHLHKIWQRAGKLPRPSRLVRLTPKYRGSLSSLENNAIKLSFNTKGNKITLASFEDKQNHDQLILNAPLFELLLANGKVVTSNDFTIVAGPESIDVQADENSCKPRQQICREKYSADLENPKLGLKIHWEAGLQDGSNYVRQIFTLVATDSVRIAKITLVKLPATIGVKKEGTVDCSPLVRHNMFFSVEHPMSQVLAEKSFVSTYLPRLQAVNASHHSLFHLFGV